MNEGTTLGLTGLLCRQILVLWLASHRMTLAISFCVGQMNSLLHQAYRGGSPVDAAEAGVSGLDYHGRLQQLIYLLTN